MRPILNVAPLFFRPKTLCFFLFLLCFWWMTGFLACSQQPSTSSAEQGADASTQDGTSSTDSPTIRAHEFPTGCHPFAANARKGCMLPFPSSYYLVKEKQSYTGYRIAFPNRLPAADHVDTEIKWDPKQFRRRDGFSPISPILVLFKKQVDPKTLPGVKQLSESIKSTSSIQLIEFGTHKRIPLFAEVDSNAEATESQVLIIRPMIRLLPNRRYAVVILKSVMAKDGTKLSAPPAYQKLVAGEAPDSPAMAALAPLVRETNKEIKDAGLAQTQVLFSWDFRTGSDKQLHSQLMGMRDEVLQRVGEDGPTYTITQTREITLKESPHLLRLIRGVMHIPSYLNNDTENAVMLYDKNGKPKLRGEGKFYFQVHIPRCVLERKEPVPVMMLGHGVFGSARSFMQSGSQLRLIQRLCVIEIAHDWLGLSSRDAGTASIIATDFNQLLHLVERLQQAHINGIAMARMVIRRLRKEPKLQVNGKPVIDNKQLYYLGISNGAIQGGTLMALSPDIQRAVLNVGGGGWSFLMSRSSSFSPLTIIMKTYYPNVVDRQLLLALSQIHFDLVDPITYAPYLLKDSKRFGVPPKKILLQEGVGDANVSNLTTRLLARTLDLPGIQPLFEPVYGIRLKKPPFVGSGYAQYGPLFPPVPKNENKPAKPNKTHNAVNSYDSAIRQIGNFFHPDGKVTLPCKDTCNPD